MKKRFKLNYNIIFTAVITTILTLGLSLSLQSILAQWMAPTQSPPLGNAYKPIYATSTEDQIIEFNALNKGLRILGTLIVGDIANFTEDVNFTKNISVQNNMEVVGSIKIGDDAATCDSSKEGTLRYDSSNVQFCDGSSWTDISAATCTATCSTGPGCRSSAPSNSSATAATCCGGTTCYACNSGYTWNGSSCVASCTPTCSTGPGCRTSLTNGSVVSGVCCSGSCYACNSGYTWNGSSCVASCTPTCSTAPGCRSSAPSNSSATAATCCGGTTCYTCNSGYTWNSGLLNCCISTMGNSCGAATCVYPGTVQCNGTCNSTYMPSNTPCTGGVCNGSGSCVQCVQDSNCGSNATCSSNTCTCNADYANCDGFWSNGCEIYLGSVDYCGSCTLKDCDSCYKFSGSWVCHHMK